MKPTVPLLLALSLLLLPVTAHAGFYIDVLGFGITYNFATMKQDGARVIQPVTLGPYHYDECHALRNSLINLDVAVLGDDCREFVEDK